MAFSKVTHFFAVGLSVLFVVATTQLLPNPKLDPIKANISPPPYLEHFAFGFHMPLADSMWLRAIQDFDYCENQIAKNQCANSGWLYHMLDSITNLAPDFRIVYATGGLALTIVISDVEGASKFFDKAVKDFPNDFPILYRAAYHSLIEEKNNIKAANLLIRAAKNGGQDWFYSLANRLYADAGRKDLAQALYKQMESEGLDPGILERMKTKLDSLEK